MMWAPPPILSRPERAAWWALRLTALLLLMLAPAACARGATTRTTPGTTGVSPSQAGAPITCVAPARTSPQGGCVTVDASTGVSVRVSAAYADVTGTIVRLETSNTYGYPLTVGGRLALPSGYSLRPVLGGYSGGPGSLIVDEPLPPQDFAPHVQINLFAGFGLPIYHGFNQPTLPPAPPWLNDLGHIALRVPFIISPPRMASYTYHRPPVVEHGVGVQVQSLDISPSHSAFYGMAGGARVELRFTGLPADMELLSFIRVESQRITPDGGMMGDHGPGLIELSIPGMTVNTPVMTLLQSPEWPENPTSSVEPTVGLFGAVQFEVAFQGSGVPTGDPATLTISHIQLLTGGIDGTNGNVPTLPTYQVTLPLR